MTMLSFALKRATDDSSVAQFLREQASTDTSMAGVVDLLLGVVEQHAADLELIRQALTVIRDTHRQKVAAAERFAP
jgi:hypothetical protein